MSCHHCPHRGSIPGIQWVSSSPLCRRPAVVDPAGRDRWGPQHRWGGHWPRHVDTAELGPIIEYNELPGVKFHFYSAFYPVDAWERVCVSPRKPHWHSVGAIAHDCLWRSCERPSCPWDVLHWARFQFLQRTVWVVVASRSLWATWAIAVAAWGPEGKGLVAGAGKGNADVARRPVEGRGGVEGLEAAVHIFHPARVEGHLGSLSPGVVVGNDWSPLEGPHYCFVLQGRLPARPQCPSRRPHPLVPVGMPRQPSAYHDPRPT